MRHNWYWNASFSEKLTSECPFVNINIVLRHNEVKRYHCIISSAACFPCLFRCQPTQNICSWQAVIVTTHSRSSARIYAVLRQPTLILARRERELVPSGKLERDLCQRVSFTLALSHILGLLYGSYGNGNKSSRKVHKHSFPHSFQRNL